MNSKETTNSLSVRPGVFVGFSLFTGLAAVVAKSCCVLPLVLASSGISGVWLSRELVPFRSYFLMTAVVSLTIGWVLAIWQRKACRADGLCARRTGWLTFSILGLSTVLVGLVVLWERFEPTIIQYLSSRPG